ncbi:MAG: DUF4349 domain-containing protein [Clostridiales bacterium]|nr:DUF4349 domain-containing protein [Clostridiales bacterium]OPZ67664.1 MAG: hypothetical protein BWY81_01201 [Firmicutes bacterium ADurb.Bin467]
MNCREFMDSLDAYLDGEMSPPGQCEFLRHAQDCSKCKDELCCAETLKASLARMNDDLAVPLRAQAAWRGAVRREAGRRKSRVLYRALSTVAAAFVLLAGTTVMFRSTGVLDFGSDSAAIEDVHRSPVAAPPAEFYTSQPELAAVPAPRYASIEADGTADDAEMSPKMATFAAAEPAEPLIAEEPESIPTDQAWERLLAVSAVREMYSETFDLTREAIAGLVDEYGGTMLADAVLDEGGGRRATIAADVPSEELDAFLEALDFVGNVTYEALNRTDVSTKYYDAGGRLETMRLEQDRLNALIAEADDAAELEALEAQLEGVYAKIDELESTLRGFSTQLDHSRVDIVLNEGAPLAATVIAGGEKGEGGARQGFARSLDSLGKFFADMGVSLAVIAPYAGVGIALIGVIWVGVVLVGKRRRHE